MSRRPNILLITTDEERAALPRPAGYTLPAHERLAARGTTFTNYYAASTMCSSSRSVIYTGRHMPLTAIYDNDNMPYIRPLDPALGTLGTMLRGQGYYTTYQGKWHLSNFYPDPAQRCRPPIGSSRTGSPSGTTGATSTVVHGRACRSTR